MSNQTSEGEDRPTLGRSAGGPVSSTADASNSAPAPSTDPTPFTGATPAEVASSDGVPSAASPTEVAITGAGADGPAVAEPAAPASDPIVGRAPKQTLAGRVWIAMGCAAVLLVLIIIFIAENSRSVTISFLGAHGHISLALALLIALVVGIVLALLVGSARIVQLTREVRRHRRKLRELS